MNAGRVKGSPRLFLRGKEGRFIIMDNRHEEHTYTYRRVKLSSLYKEIGNF